MPSWKKVIVSGSDASLGTLIITGSAVIGSGSFGPYENTLTLGARDNGSEGGQLGFNAPGGTYASASFIDLYQNRLRILKGTNATSTGEVARWDMHNNQMGLPAYTSPSSFTGTVAGLLAFDSSGNILTTSAGGSGTVTSVATAGTVSGITLTGGTITTSGTITLGGSISGLTNSNLSGTAGITNANLANSAITIAGTSTSLGGSITQATILAGSTVLSGSNTISGVALGGTLAALTAGSYLTSAGTYTGATARTFAVDATSANTVSKVVARDGSGNFSAGTITATLSGTATSASLAIKADTIFTTSSITNATFYPTFVDSNNTTGAHEVPYTSQYITYNPSSKTLVTGFVQADVIGNASTATTASYATTAGTVTNATNATNTAITDTTTGAGPYYLTFVSSNSGNQAQRVDSTGLTYNATSNAITASYFKGALNGNADTATDASAVTIGSTTSGFDILGTTFGAGNGQPEYDINHQLTWDPTQTRIKITEATNTNFVTYLGPHPTNGDLILEGDSGRSYYYNNTHIFGDNAYNYQGQLSGGTFDAAGDITCGGTKYFDIPHQSKPGWGLKHAAIEGPESAVYLRGKLKDNNIIEFPAYWEWLVHEDSITISLTPIGSFQPLYVEKIENNQATIASNDQPINCHFVVYAERKDVDRWDVEYENYSRSGK